MYYVKAMSHTMKMGEDMEELENTAVFRLPGKAKVLFNAI